jgi:hypothetical protein
MRLHLEIWNEGYRHFVDTYQPVVTGPILWFCLRYDCVLQNVEEIAKGAPRDREIREDFVHVCVDLLVRFILPFVCI